jgi:hypothetical protein
MMSATVSEEVSELRAWLLAAVAGFAILVGGPTYCTVKEDNQISDMVAHGADPIGANCAIAGNDKHICLVYATQHSGK